jgi:thioredoxin reductase (NADPH)
MIEPSLAGLDAAIHRGLIRYCPICDGFEVLGREVGILGGRPHSIAEAHFMRTYSHAVTFLQMQGAEAPTPDELTRAREAGIEIEERPCLEMKIEDDKIAAIFEMGAPRKFDVVYPSLGLAPRSLLAEAMGCRISDEGELLTDKHQQTNIAGLFAAGDVLRGLDQVASACGQAAIAATAMHNLLREMDARPTDAGGRS